MLFRIIRFAWFMILNWQLICVNTCCSLNGIFLNVFIVMMKWYRCHMLKQIVRMWSVKMNINAHLIVMDSWASDRRFAVVNYHKYCFEYWFLCFITVWYILFPYNAQASTVSQYEIAKSWIQDILLIWMQFLTLISL